MRPRFLPLVALVCAVSGCASMDSSFPDDRPAEAYAPVTKITPEQAYNDGVILQERGEYDAARREWDRCVQLSAPDSPARLDCMVALEKLALPVPSPKEVE